MQLVILDDLEARREAVRLGIATVGAVGLVVLAWEGGIIDTALTLLVALRDGGLYLSDRIIRRALEQAGAAQRVGPAKTDRPDIVPGARPQLDCRPSQERPR